MSTVSSTVLHVNTQNGSPQILLHEDCDPIHTVACHPKQPVVAMGNHRGILKVWNYKTKVIVCRKVFEKNEQIQCIAFDRHGELVYLLSNSTELLHGQCFCFMTLQFVITFSVNSCVLVSEQDCTWQLALSVELFIY